MCVSGLPGDRGSRPREVGEGEGDVRAPAGVVLLLHVGAGHLRHQSYLGVQYDEEAGRRLPHDRVSQVSVYIYLYIYIWYLYVEVSLYLANPYVLHRQVLKGHVYDG